MRIWEECEGHLHITPLLSLSTVWRIVEDQCRSSTRNLVDTLKEHDILEKMLDRNKPEIVYYGDETAFKGLHYLLFTPFRYPPLDYGSRFANQFERNLFYTSIDLKTAMAEKAFHRFNLIQASDGKIAKKHIKYNAFSINLKINKGIDLTKLPFSDYRERISSPVSYHESRALGEDIRNNSIEAFISYSARCREDGKNVNIFSPSAFAENKFIEKTFQNISCYYTQDIIEFYSGLDEKPICFNLQDFFVHGEFPLVA